MAVSDAFVTALLALCAFVKFAVAASRACNALANVSSASVKKSDVFKVSLLTTF
ncbi:hypothetical protein D3C86_2198270 [compost metagenome]